MKGMAAIYSERSDEVAMNSMAGLEMRLRLLFLGIFAAVIKVIANL